MKILLILVVFVCVKFQDVNSESEFVTLWTPKFVQEDARYRLFVLPTDVTRKTEIAVQFRKSSAAFMLTDGKISTIEYPSVQRNFGGMKSVDLSMTLYRNMSTRAGTQMHCSTKSIQVFPSTGNFHNFIQTDKPIYKPGDTVRYRVLTVDKDLKPFHRTTILVNMTDPFGREMNSTDDQEGKFSGVFESNFTLGDYATLGDWKIVVVVDNKKQFATSKVFSVQKYTLPLFDVHIDIPVRHVLQQDNITLSIFAKYSFEEFVRGNAELTIKRVEDGKIYLKTKLNNIKEPLVTSFNLKKLGVITMDQVELEAFVLFTEPESKTEFNATAKFYAHYDNQHKLIVEHTQKFLPGFPFAIHVYVKNWKDEIIMNHYEKIDLTHKFKLKNGEISEIQTLGLLKDGVYINENIIPNDYVELSIIVKFVNCKTYRESIEMGSVNVGKNLLVVSHSPEKPKVNDVVTIYVTTDSLLKNVVMAVITRYGISRNQQIHCKNVKMCEFQIQISEEMMPDSTVMVYDVKKRNDIDQGQTKIITENVGRNELKLEIPTEIVKTKQQINMKFTTKARSKIYLLAFDRRLNSLKSGNDITKDDVVKSLSDYDGENLIISDDMSNWTPCTSEEIERLERGRTYIVKHSKDSVFSKESEENLDETGNWEEEGEKKDEKPTPDDLLREHFPETWIFESFDVGSAKTIEKTFKTPDSITTWMISAFALHKQAGLALVPTQELTVKNDFFVKMELPYSIRYLEVLKLKILTFNFIKTNEELNVNLKLYNIKGMQFEFVDYHNCKPTYNIENSDVAETNFKILPNEVKSAFFYIRSNQKNKKFNSQVENQIILRVEATATDKSGKEYVDRVQKKLKLEPVGVKKFTVDSDFYKLDNTRVSRSKHANYSVDLSSINVVVTGDFLSKSFNLEKLESLPSACLEQRTSKLKRFVESFRYLKFIGKEVSKKEASKLYQDILKGLTEKYTYVKHPWYQAYLADVLATAMECEALAPDKAKIDEILKFVNSKQESNGTFSNFEFYYDHPGKKGTAEYIATMQYFSAAYCLIPYLKHKDFVGTDYDVFIQRGLKYLLDQNNRVPVTRYGQSVAAYALALRGDNKTINEAKLILEELEKTKLHRGNKKCYRVSSSDYDCNKRHTTFIALAYIKLNDLINAEPIVHWLIEKRHADDMTTGNNAIMTEPIAEMAMKLSTKDTSLNVMIKNERSFSTQLAIKEFNSFIPQNVAFPEYSEKVLYEISGRGYCTVSMIFESIITLPQVILTFTVRTMTSKSSVPNHRILVVCAKYTPGNITRDGIPLKAVIPNVIYEIEMPSGYTFIESPTGKLGLLAHINHIDSKKGGTLVQMYLHDVDSEHEYCADLEARREFIVNEASDAGIKVYDYEYKDKMAIHFYRFDSREC